MISVDFFDNRIAMFRSRSEVACSLTLDALPGDLDLYVYLNFEMAIVWLQLVLLCCDAKSYFKSVECIDCRRHVGCVLSLRSWSVIGLSSSLLPPLGAVCYHILDCNIYK